MKRELQQRLQWVRRYEETSDAGFVCRRCGISRPTLREWSRRYQPNGIEGLKSRGRQPHHSPKTKAGKSPMERHFDLMHDTPYSDEAYENYMPAAERIQNPNYKLGLELKRLKRCL